MNAEKNAIANEAGNGMSARSHVRQSPQTNAPTPPRELRRPTSRPRLRGGVILAKKSNHPGVAMPMRTCITA